MKKIMPDITTVYIFAVVIIYTTIVQRVGIDNMEKVSSILIPLFFIPYLNGELNRNGLEKEYKKKFIIISSVVGFLIIILLTVSIFGVPVIPFLPNSLHINNALIWAFIYSAFVMAFYKSKMMKKKKLWFGSLIGIWGIVILLSIGGSYGM